MAITKPKAYEFNGETGEEIVRDLTANEIAEIEAFQSARAVEVAALEAKTTARASALAKLAELGLTEEEIQAL